MTEKKTDNKNFDRFCSAFQPCGMWPERNTACGPASSWGRAATVVVLILTALATTAATHAQNVTAPSPDWSHARHAHRLVERWLDQGGVSEQPPESGLTVQGMSGVMVMLRWSGQAVGKGEALVENPREPVRLEPLVWRAARDAIAQTQASMRDARQKSRELGEVEGDTDISIEAVADRLSVSVEVGGKPEPIVQRPGSTHRELIARFIPGWHGLMMAPRSRPNQRAAVWPGEALARNIPPGSQLVQLLVATGHAPEHLIEVAQPDGPMLWRFEVIHCARPAPNEPVLELVRGNRPLPPRPISEASIRTMAGRITDHLLGRVRDDGSVMGEYAPASGRYHPESADPDNAALLAYALAHRAAALGEDATERRDLLARRTRRVLRRLADGPAEQVHPLAPAPTALLVLTWHALPDDPATRPITQTLAQRLIGVTARQMPAGDTAPADDNDADADPATALSTPEQCLVLAALAREHRRTREGSIAQVLETHLPRLVDQVEITAQLTSATWLDTALRHWRPDADSPTVDKLRDDWRARLADAGAELRDLQISSVSAPLPTDVIGGVPLGGSLERLGDWREPDWRTAMAMDLFAATLRDPQLLSREDQLSTLLAGSLAARFIGQLMFDRISAYYVRQPSEAIGGVRASLWDHSLGVAPSAMSLLATTDLLAAIEAMSQNGQ